MSTIAPKSFSLPPPVEKLASPRVSPPVDSVTVTVDQLVVWGRRMSSDLRINDRSPRHVVYSGPKYFDLYDMRPVDRVSLVKSGVPSRIVGSISSDMGVPKDRFVKIIGLSKATINRKIANETALSADESEKLVGLARLIGQVESIVKDSGSSDGFKAAKWFGDWIVQPAPALGGRKPDELLDTADGREAISRLLAQMQSGAYA